MNIKKRKVVFYGRVSTEHDAQLSAFDNQMQWYEDLLKTHEDWELVHMYSDKGVTGTQAKKRPGFMKMIEDAKKSMFDLIVTREVCRFARNTVDTLTYIRELRKAGVEVYFVQDNIWTFSSQDELKLTIMASLAQQESAKISERVRAGQATSRKNGILYGNGNILGYTLVRGRNSSENTYVIDDEQAETVRIIYKLCLEGKGQKRICQELELLGRKNAEGEVKWCPSKISRILHNKTYAGYKGYLKSHVEDYLEHSRVLNRDLSSYIYEKGDWEPIISEEEWNRVQEILEQKTVHIKDKQGKSKRTGKNLSSDVWLHKLKCSCGSSYNRCKWRTNKKSGEEVFGYQCYNQHNNGSLNFRIKNNLSTEGYCGIKMTAEWKLDFMAKNILEVLWSDRKNAVDEAMELIEKYYSDESSSIIKNDISALTRKIEKLRNRIKSLLDMRMDGEISKEEYAEYKNQIESEISEIQTKLDEQPEQEENESATDRIITNLKTIRSRLEEYVDFSGNSIDKDIIEHMVVQIIPLADGKYKWVLNLIDKFTGKEYDITCSVTGRKNNSSIMFDSNELQTISFAGEKDIFEFHNCSGCYQG